jgi:DNA-binding sugar fermentation-stimulating protein
LLAKKTGVQFLAYKCKIDPVEVTIKKKLKIINE